MGTEGHRATPGHYWGHSQWNVTITLSGFTWDPWCRGSFRLKSPSCSSCPVVFHGADKCPVTVAVLESFSGQAARTERWQVLGTQEMLFPDLVSNLLGLVLWFKFEHTGCEDTRIILQFVAHFQLPQHKWFVRTVLPKPVLHFCSKLQCSCHFALDQGDTHRKVPKF